LVGNIQNNDIETWKKISLLLCNKRQHLRSQRLKLLVRRSVLHVELKRLGHLPTASDIHDRLRGQLAIRHLDAAAPRIHHDCAEYSHFLDRVDDTIELDAVADVEWVFDEEENDAVENLRGRRPNEPG